MKIRDLERLCSANGIGPTKADMVTRSLREAGELPVGGRGANAPDAGAADAAKLLIALSGSSKGGIAARRLDALGALRSGRGRRTTLLNRFTALLEGHADLARLSQCRIGRNVREAQFVFADGEVEVFSLRPARDYSTRLRVEGVIPSAFLQRVANLIRDNASVPAANSDAEECDDS